MSVSFHAARPPVSASMAAILTALAAIFWGTNFEATRIALQGLPPWTAAAGRFVPAGVVAMCWLVLRGGPVWPRGRANWAGLVLLALLGVAGFNAALFLGMQTASPVTAALIMGTSPLTTNLLDSALDRRWPRPVAVLGMAISLFGVALTTGALRGAHFAPGDMLILAGSLLLALYTIGSRRLLRDVPPIQNTAWTMLIGGGILLAMAFLLEPPVAALAAAPASAIWAEIYMALIGSVLAFLFWQIGVAVRGPGPTAVIYNILPVSALCVAAAMGRIPGPAQIGGAALVIAGVLLASGRLRIWRCAKIA